MPWHLWPLARLGETRPNSPHTEEDAIQGGAEGARDAALRAALAGPAEERALHDALDAAVHDNLCDRACAAMRSGPWDRVLGTAGMRGSAALYVVVRGVVGESIRRVIGHPAQARYADLWRPMADAYADGLLAFRVGPDEVGSARAPPGPGRRGPPAPPRRRRDALAW